MPSPCARLLSLTLALTLAVLQGCSGEEGESSTDLSKPLVGKAPTKDSQFEGRWVRLGEAEVDFMEFRKDGKALVGDEGMGLTVDYAVLDRGRLSLEMQGGMTTVFDATVAGDQLELVSGGNLMFGAGTWRYRRLGQDETVQSALQAQARAKAEAYERRVAALEAFLGQPGLVLAFSETGAGAPASIALEIEASGESFGGQAWHDDRPPHRNAISGRLLLDASAGAAQLQVTHGKRIAPPTTQPDGGGQILMQVEGDDGELVISAQVTFGGTGPAHTMVLRSDPKLHAEIVARYEAELERIERLKQPLVALLKDFTVLRGTLQSQDPRRTEPDTIELELARDPASGEYWVEGVYTGPTGRGELVASAGAEIAVVGEQPVLRIVTPPSREYQLSMQPESGAGPAALSGRWSPVGGNQNNAARFEVLEALDAQARDTKFEARRQVLRSLGPSSVFEGLAHEDSASGMQMPIPFQLELSPGADGSFSGQAEYPTVSTVMTVEGRLAETRFGPRLELGYTGAESTPADQIFLRSIKSGAWHLVPRAGDGPLQLEGFFSGPPVRPTVLTQVDDDSRARLRARLVELMSSGERLQLSRFVGWQAPGVEPTVVDWTLEAASGALTGDLILGGRALGTNETLFTRYEGELKEVDGWLVLDVLQIATKAMPGGQPQDRWVGALRLYVGADRDGVLHLNGQVANPRSVRRDEPLPEFPSELGRLVELLPLEATDAASRTAIDQALAAAERARAEAEAAAEAANLAALEVRRIQLAPFYPLLRSESGLVITTDAPANLGTVLTEVVIDEERATVVGKGVELREMPLLDFSFECDLDNRGNLTLTTSIRATPYKFAPPQDDRVAKGQRMTLTALTPAERAELDAKIALGKRLQGSAQAILAVEILDPATAKAREASLNATSMPGVAIYKNARNDKVAAMFTVESRGRYRWAKEPITQRLDQPMKGKALYLKNGGPTDNLVVIVNGVHRAVIPAIAQLGAAVVELPPDLEILDLRLQADGTAQTSAVMLLE